MRHLNVDIETFSSVDIKKSGMHKYVQSPDFEILLLAYSFDGAPVQIVDLAQGEQLPGDVVSAMFSLEFVKHAYNAPFEWYCLSKFFNLDRAEDWIHQWRCTMFHGLYCGYTAGLGATAVALGLPEDKRKMGVGMSLIRTFCMPCKPTKTNGGRTRTRPHHEPEKWKLFKDYCVQDVVTESTIEYHLSAFPVPVQEQRLWELDQRINAYGVAVDMELVESAIAVHQTVTDELMVEAVKLSGLDNPKSVQQLTQWLEKETGEEITDLRKGTVSDLIKTTDEGDAKRMLEIRQELSKTSVKKYNAMREAVCSDGRVRGLLQFYGAGRTGRWAGRLVQVQNLPRNYLETLSHARDCVRARKIDALKVIYGNVPDTLSQLIRTAFVPSPGHVFIVSDFSAIEARVIAWLAGEQWRLDVFNTHGKIYEASASQMFGVPLERITKGNPEYELRAKGKVAELALGYGGGANALIAMDSKHELNEDELPEIVHRWRSSSKRIVDLWYSLENAAIDVMRNGQTVGVKGLLFARESHHETGQDFLTVTLPSGRQLFYAQPFLAKNDHGQEAFYYHGANQTTRKWEVISTWGGKIVENCLAGDTQVLTDRGWLPITQIVRTDRVWDGIDWVSHQGVVENGVQQTMSLEGVRLTAGHRVLTETGWRSASSCEGYYRATVRLPNSDSVRRFEWKKVSVDSALRLRERNHSRSQRVQERQTKVMRLSTASADIAEPNNARNVSPSSICRVAIDDRPLSTSDPSSVAQLWRARDNGLYPLGREFRSILGRHGSDVSTRADYRTNQRERGLQTGELLLGHSQTAGQQQEKQPRYLDALGSNDRGAGRRSNRDQPDDSVLSSRPWLARKPITLRPGRTEPVFDVLNAGPRHRFVVRGANGPLIVHNCVQAIARDCLAETLSRLDALGSRTVFHVHDEDVSEVPADKADLEAITAIMGQPIPWAPGLPLKADGFVTSYYKKD